MKQKFKPIRNQLSNSLCGRLHNELRYQHQLIDQLSRQIEVQAKKVINDETE